VAEKVVDKAPVKPIAKTPEKPAAKTADKKATAKKSETLLDTTSPAKP
jgi:hypothetical protein